jgi:hypothetical protein
MAWTTEESWFDSRQGEDVFLFSETSRTALVPTQTLIQWVMVALSNGVTTTPHPTQVCHLGVHCKHFGEI